MNIQSVDMANIVWQWPNTGPTPVNYGLDSEIFDSEKFPHIQTFVREAIQNSLDARLDKTIPAKVRFAFYSEPLSSQVPFFADLKGKKNECGLHWPDAWKTGKISWLVVEDSNTSGLEGDLGKRTSDFWNYWLNFGISNKDGKGRGGRGIGRITFLIASQISSVIGVTRRRKDGKIATCGMSLMRPTETGNDFKSSYAYMAQKASGSIYELYEDASLPSDLASAFKIAEYKAHRDCYGFSLVIPYPHENLTPQGIIAAAIEHFGPAIINGSLVVQVDETLVDSDTIDAEAAKAKEQFSSQTLKEDPSRLLALIKKSAIEHNFVLKIADTSQLDANIDADLKSEIKSRFQQKGEVTLALEIPVSRLSKVTFSRILVALSQAPKDMRPVDSFYREGMCLPEVVARNPADVDLIVQSTDGDLVSYLNFCEGKAHLGLIENADVANKLKDNGFDDRFRIKRLVRKLMDELRLLVLPDTSEPDASVFSNFFSVPIVSAPQTSKKIVRKNVVIKDPPPPKKRIFIIEELEDGFRIKANPEHTEWPMGFKVEVAYADGSRKPNWSRHDFQFRDLTIVNATGAKISSKDNILSGRDCKADFSLEVQGFDTRRELVTNLRPVRHA